MKVPQRFSDDPKSKIVKVHYEDGTVAILEAVSFNRYTPPPGYRDFTVTNLQQFNAKYGEVSRKRIEQYKNCAYFHALTAFN